MGFGRGTRARLGRRKRQKPRKEIAMSKYDKLWEYGLRTIQDVPGRDKPLE